jgi:sugar-specific transcriptional regulator TrmB/predicted hydrocarbon binding protein
VRLLAIPNMPINEERLGRMKELGLTEYQARVYLILLDLGISKASQIPTLSRVPRTRIYSTMNQLHEKGLVEIIPESPIKYKPVPIEDYLERVAESHRQTASDIVDKKDFLTNEFAIRAIAEAEETGGFEAIYGRRNVRDRLNRMYEESEREILSVGTVQSPTRILRSRLPTIEERFHAGVEIKYAFPVNGTNKDNAQILSQYADVRNIDLTLSMYYLVVDSRQALLCHPIPSDESFLKGDDIAIWTDDEGIADALRNIAMSVFEQGRDLDEVDFATPLLQSAKAYIDLLGLDAKQVYDSLASTIGKELSSNFESKTPVGLIKELSAFWEENSLGTLQIVNKKPLTVKASQFFKCGVETPHKPHTFCEFTRTLLDVILVEKLNGKAGIKEHECLGESEGLCHMSFVIK